MSPEHFATRHHVNRTQYPIHVVVELRNFSTACLEIQLCISSVFGIRDEVIDMPGKNREFRNIIPGKFCFWEGNVCNF